MRNGKERIRRCTDEMGIRTGIGLVIGIMTPVLYFLHDDFRNFVDSGLSSVLAGIEGL